MVRYCNPINLGNSSSFTTVTNSPPSGSKVAKGRNLLSQASRQLDQLKTEKKEDFTFDRLIRIN